MSPRNFNLPPAPAHDSDADIDEKIKELEKQFEAPFGVEQDMFTPIPPKMAEGKPDGSIYPTLTDSNDRQGDKD